MHDGIGRIQDYFKTKKELSKAIIAFINGSNELEYDENLIKIFHKQKFLSKPEEFEHFLLFILNICNNYNRIPGFFDKIEQILLFLKTEIEQTFSKLKLFNLFKSHKLILLLLIKNELIKLDENTVNSIRNEDDQNGFNYYHFFLPEIKEFIQKDEFEKIESELLEYNPSIFEKFEEKRRIGENESRICTLIRNDSIEEFVPHVYKQNIPLTSKIYGSFFETNPFLIGKEPTLIEYAAFYGSIQIFQFLKLSGVELERSLWKYVIHSNTGELIHLLETENVRCEDNGFLDCFIEAIKCHHNDIAVYIRDILLKVNDDKLVNEKVTEASFHYCNYFFIPKNLIQNFPFFYLCKFHYNEIVNIFLLMKKDKMEHFKISSIIILIKFKMISFVS